MPARNQFDLDFEKHIASATTTCRMLEIQTAALARICRLDLSLQSAIAAKDIARNALCDSVKLAPPTEVSNA